MRNVYMQGFIFACFAFFALNAKAVLLYTASTEGDRLGYIDTNNLAAGIIDVGSLGTNFQYGGLAYDSNSGTMYMLGGRFNENLYTVDISTGQSTLVGPHGQIELYGLAFDTNNDTLYAVEYEPDTPLHTLDVNNGSSTSTGNIIQALDALAYDSFRDLLLGVYVGAGDLYQIDITTGGTTLLDDGSYINTGGLTYDPVNDLIWGLDYDGRLYNYDPTNSYLRTQVATLDRSYAGLTWVGTTSVPEPTTLALLSLGLAGLGITRRKMKA